MTSGRLAVVVLALGLVGCAGDLTELVVMVDSDLAVPSQLDEVRIDVDGVVGGPVTARAQLTGMSAVTLPGTLGVVHAQGPLGPVTVTAAGYLRGARVVSQVARTSFIEGHTLVLHLHLLRSCRAMTCPMDETCDATGCHTIDVPASSLADWPGDAGTSDAGMLDSGGLDGGAVDSGPVDAGPRDAGADAGPRDAGADAGPTCDTLYGAGMDYVLCSETPTSCRVAVTTAGMSCDTFCTSFGGTCLSADQNGPGRPVCVVSSPDTCAGARTNNICVCSR